MTGAPPPGADDPLEAIRAMNRDIGKIVSPEGVELARYLTLGGARQWITVRAQDRRAPLLLYFHGGPGGALSDIAYMFQRPWEDYFTVVQWDQRGFGRSAIDGAGLQGTLNVEQVVADAIELIEHLLGEFDQPKLFVLGQSWGSALALEVAHRRPDLFYAAAGIGQNVDMRGTFVETHRLMTHHARATNDETLARQLTALGPMPSIDDLDAWNGWVGTVQTEMVRRGFSWRNFQGPEPMWSARIIAGRLVAPNLDPPVTPDPPFEGGPAAPFAEMIRSVARWSARESIGVAFKVPIIILHGRYDWQTPITLARAYFEEIVAPHKRFVEFPQSAHVVTMEEPGRMIVTLVKELLPFAATVTPGQR